MWDNNFFVTLETLYWKSDEAVIKSDDSTLRIISSDSSRSELPLVEGRRKDGPKESKSRVLGKSG